jgi:hypothetical protein
MPQQQIIFNFFRKVKYEFCNVEIMVLQNVRCLLPKGSSNKHEIFCHKSTKSSTIQKTNSL